MGAKLCLIRRTSSRHVEGRHQDTDSILAWYTGTAIDMVQARSRQWHNYLALLPAHLILALVGALTLVILGMPASGLGAVFGAFGWWTFAAWSALIDMRNERRERDRSPVAYGIACCGGVDGLPANAVAAVEHEPSRATSQDQRREFLELYHRWLCDQHLTVEQEESYHALLDQYDGTVGELVNTARRL